MAEWSAWDGTRALAFLHRRARELLRRQGVEDAFFDHRGHPVHYYSAGPKDAERTVVLLHGLGVSADDWFRAIPLLAWRGDRVIAPDLPGHGLSPPPDERGFAQVSEHAKVVRALVDQESGTRDIAIVGHSLGGWVGVRAHLAGLAADRLVLAESAGLTYEGIWDGIEMLRIEHEEDVKRFFRTITHKVPFGLNLLSKEIATTFRSPAVVNFIDQYDRKDLIEDDDLAGVTAQTTILWGENDGLIPPVLAHRWNMGILGSKLVWIPRCGHAPHFERPILFQQLIEEALGHPPLTTAVRDRLSAKLPEPVRKRLPWT